MKKATSKPGRAIAAEAVLTRIVINSCAMRRMALMALDSRTEGARMMKEAVLVAARARKERRGIFVVQSFVSCVSVGI